MSNIGTQKSKDATGSVIPSFSLPSSVGKTVTSWDYKSRSNLAIVFLPNPQESACRSFLREFAHRYGDYRQRTSDVLVILPNRDIAEAKRLKDELGLPFHVLSDRDGDVYRRFDALIGAANTDAAMFIADRFGQIWAHSHGKTCQELFSQDETLRWLDFIELQCPE